MFKYLYSGKTKSYKILFLTTLILIMLVSAMDIAQGFLFMIFMNRALNINSHPLWLLIIIGINFVIIYYLLSLSSSILLSTLLKKIRAELVHDSMTEILNLPASEFLTNESPSVVTNFISNEVENLVNNFYNYIFQLFGVACSIVLGLIYLSYLSVYFIIPILLTIFFLFLIMFFAKKKINSNYQTLFMEKSLMIKLINNVSNFFLISKMFSYKKFLVQHLAKEYEDYNKQHMKTTRFDLIIEKINGGLALILFIALYSIAVVLALAGELNGGEIVAIIQVCSTVVAPFFSITYVFKAISNTKSTRTKILKLLKVSDSSNSKENLSIIKIEVKDLSFAYNENTKIFDHFYCKFEIGDCVGLIGESGSGKSTLLSLISKLIDSYAGEILINDGINSKNITDQAYFKNVKLLTQNPILLNESVKKNIILDSDFDEKKFYKIFNQLQLNRSFENGNYRIDTEKQNYSLGEARRICLARILYSNPQFIFLDEPFASLDEENRLIIEEVICSLNKSCVVVASHIFSDDFLKKLNKKIYLKK